MNRLIVALSLCGIFYGGGIALAASCKAGLKKVAKFECGGDGEPVKITGVFKNESTLTDVKVYQADYKTKSYKLVGKVKKIQLGLFRIVGNHRRRPPFRLEAGGGWNPTVEATMPVFYDYDYKEGSFGAGDKMMLWEAEGTITTAQGEVTSFDLGCGPK